MMPAAVQQALGADVALSASYGELVADVDRARWVDVVEAARDRLGLRLFDLLTAVDLQADGFEVVLRLWSVPARTGLRLRTRCPRAEPEIASLAGLFAGARWHERQAAELFGLVFVDHPGLTPLLLAPQAVPHPLRKDVVLQRRVDTAWPGAKEPGESDADLTGRPRRRNLPLGVAPESRTP